MGRLRTRYFSTTVICIKASHNYRYGTNTKWTGKRATKIVATLMRWREGNRRHNPRARKHYSIFNTPPEYLVK